MEINQRTRDVQIAQTKLSLALGEFFKDYPKEFTTAEELQILTNVFSTYLTGTIRFLIKVERGEELD